MHHLCLLLFSLGALFAVSPTLTRIEAQETADTLLKKGRAVLSPTAGDLRLPGLKAPVEVLRDRWGVPHIYAQNTDDLFFAQGVVVAQDRLFQIDWWRRVGVGETAEVLGPRGVEGDRFARLVRYRGDMKAEWASYGPDAKRVATAFTRGINAWIDHIGDRLPLEFQLLKYRPKKWQPEDCLGRMSGIIMTRNLPYEIIRSQLITAVGLAKARMIAPTDPPYAFAPAEGLDLAGIDGRVLQGFAAAAAPLRLAALPLSESNNWVVDGSRSVSGKPMLASDPHRPTSLPSLRYLVHLHAPGWHMIGSGEPGLPGVALGHNDHIAWGITVIGTDQADLYVEQTKPGDASQYKVGDAWENMTVVREQVAMRGGKSVEVVLRYTRHGPVLFEDPVRKRALALKWVGSEPGTAAYFGALAVSKAKNKKEFLAALKGWKVPALNIVYADKDGHIGWVAAGLTPIRKGYSGLLPVPGHEGKYEWQGFLPVEELPQSFDPPTHFIATANHNILPPGYKHLIGLEWSPPYRFRQVKSRLEGNRKLTLAEFGDIQHDNTSQPGLILARLLDKVELPKQPKQLSPAVEQLRQWSGRLTRASLAGPLYALWLQELQEEFYEPHVPPNLLESVRRLSGLPTMLTALEKADPAWFGKDAVQKRDLLVRKTLMTAVLRLEKLSVEGRPPSWGQLHKVTFHHPLGDLSPTFAKALNLGPLSRPGDGNSPNNTFHDYNFRQYHGASYRQLFDLVDWDRGLATSAPGQSGQPGSPHYKDLLPLWAEGEYFPFVFSRPRVEQVTKQRLQLQP